MRFHISDALIQLPDAGGPSAAATGNSIGQTLAKLLSLGTATPPGRPGAVTGIPVGQKLARLHLLHAAADTGKPRGGDGTLIGQYTVHYADSATATIPIVYGQDVRNWWNIDDWAPVTRAYAVWTGNNPVARKCGRTLRLYLRTWENPHPEKKVVGIDMRSANTTAAPFCVAITAENDAGAD